MSKQKAAAKRRPNRRNIYTKMQSELVEMGKPIAAKFPVLGNECSRAHAFLQLREKMQQVPLKSLSGATIMVSLQTGILSDEEWHEILGVLYLHSPEWNLWIESLFEQLVGRKPDRGSSQTITLEANALWQQVSLIYTEEQLRFLEDAWNYKVDHGRHFTHTEKLRYYYHPLSFEALPKQEDGDGTALSSKLKDLRSRIKDEEDDHYGGRYGYGVKLPARQTQDEPVNPEQVAHAEQDAIDAAFNELMQGVEL